MGATAPTSGLGVRNLDFWKQLVELFKMYFRKKNKIIEVFPISQFTKAYQNEFPSVLPSSDFNSVMNMSFYGFYIGMRSVIPQKSKTKSACIGRTSPPVDSDNCITALKFYYFFNHWAKKIEWFDLYTNYCIVMITRNRVVSECEYFEFLLKTFLVQEVLQLWS